jgi:hypothetical protein
MYQKSNMGVLRDGHDSGMTGRHFNAADRPVPLRRRRTKRAASADDHPISWETRIGM